MNLIATVSTLIFPFSLRNASTFNRRIYLSLPLWVFTYCLIPVLDKVEWYACKVFFYFQFKFNEQLVRSWRKKKVAIIAQRRLLLMILQVFVFDLKYIASVVDFLKKYKREKVDNRNIVISPTSSGKLLVRFRLSSFVYHLVW